jgi:glutamate N-acetyltransferase/amino-acid N-acetyltransferase
MRKPMCRAAADAIGAETESVLVCSTGIIGTPLPLEHIIKAVPKLAQSLSRDGANDAARGILTTDHVPRKC